MTWHELSEKDKAAIRVKSIISVVLLSVALPFTFHPADVQGVT